MNDQPVAWQFQRFDGKWFNCDRAPTPEIVAAKPHIYRPLYASPQLDTAEVAKLRKQLVSARREGMKAAMEIVGNMRQSEAGLFDAKHSGQRGCDRSDALYDAYKAIFDAERALPQTDEEGEV